MAGPKGDERAWIRGAQAGNASDFEALFRAHWAQAFRAAYLVVHDAAAAEDIAQEAFLAAVRRHGGEALQAERLDTDHGFNDRRVELATRVLRWLAALAGAPPLR